MKTFVLFVYFLIPTTLALGNEWLQLPNLDFSMGYYISVEFRDSMYTFGGENSLFVSNETWSYNFTSKIWSLINSTGIASPRTRHSAVVVFDKMFVFGGFNGLNYEATFQVFFIQNQTWMSECLGIGQLPEPRSSHSTIITSQNLVLLFGGIFYFFAK